ncbi:MAG TPA: M20/M25/M40 family metallo-hydrolase [Gaiellaceae bacterium]|nr:M20/M25/M40 family metallo-hydrolase [Gaiellaceae bacterium]
MEQPPLTSPFVDLFLELCALPSPSGKERAVADRVTAYLDDLGLDWDEDAAAATLNGDTGNVYCRIPPTNGAGGTPIFLCAHTDTVPPEAAIEPVVGDDGVIRNSAGTILGSDNKAAVVVMLEAVRRVLEDGREHAGIELLFTPQEEVSLRGADAFDHTRFVATTGYVYDQGAPIGEVVLGSPHARLLDFRFHGAAAHAGMHPEDGRSAIAAASRAIADFRLGRVDEETSANVGVITGGTARNVVPEWCSFTAEVRSHDEHKAISLAREMVESAAFAASLADCEVESEVRPSFPGYRFRETDPAVRLAAAALERAGYTPSYALSGGGADANVFNARGLSCVNLANGMTDIHTPEERIAVAALEGMVEVTLALIDVARETNGGDQAEV